MERIRKNITSSAEAGCTTGGILQNLLNHLLNRYSIVGGKQAIFFPAVPSNNSLSMGRAVVVITSHLNQEKEDEEISFSWKTTEEEAYWSLIRVLCWHDKIGKEVQEILQANLQKPTWWLDCRTPSFDGMF